MLDKIRDIETVSTPAPTPAAPRRLSRRILIATVTAGVLVLGVGGVVGFTAYAHHQDMKVVNVGKDALNAQKESLDIVVTQAKALATSATTAIFSNPINPVDDLYTARHDVDDHLKDITYLLAIIAATNFDDFAGDLAASAQALTDYTAELGTAETNLEAALPALETALTTWEVAELDSATTVFTTTSAALAETLLTAQASLAGSEGLVADDETRVALTTAIDAGSAAASAVPDGTSLSYKDQAGVRQIATADLALAIERVRVSQKEFTAQTDADA